MNIALISTPFFSFPPDRYSGLETMVWNLANGLIKRGHKVVCFAPKGHAPKGGFLVETNKPLSGVFETDWLVAEQKAWGVYDKLLDDNFDIINGHNWFGMEYASKKRNPALKVCHTHHGGLNMQWWGRERPPFKLNMIAISDWMTKVYTSQGIPAKRAYNGIDLDQYHYKSEKGDRLLFVGRLDDFKRPHLSIKVAKKLGIPIDVVGATFVGNLPYLEAIKKMCDGVSVVCHLDASHEKKMELLQNAKCVLFNGKMGEPMGLVPVEAMACGTPVVASDDGAVREIVTHDVGIVCPYGVTEDIEVEIIAKAVTQIDRIQPENCRRRVEQYFTQDKMAESYEKLYQDIIENREW